MSTPTLWFRTRESLEEVFDEIDSVRRHRRYRSTRADLQTTVELTYEVEGETKQPSTAEVIPRLQPTT